MSSEVVYKLGDSSVTGPLLDLLDDNGLPLGSYGYLPDDDSGLANLGDSDSGPRGAWYDRLQLLNKSIEKAANEYSNTSSDLKGTLFPVFNSNSWDDLSYFETTDLSGFKELTRYRAEKFFWGDKYPPAGVTAVVKNSILIWQALSGQFGYSPFRWAAPGPAIDGNLGRWTLDRVDNLIFVINAELDAIVEVRDQTEATEDYILGTAGINYQQNDIDFIMNNDDFSRFFSTTFDSDTISLIPLIYNFYLTSEYFQGINEAFKTPKDRVLDIILSTIANDNNFDSTPDMSRPAAAAAIANSTGQDQQSAFNSASRDFILKMLIKTPIDILKGLTELIDPHVAITKVIKTGTGFAFNAAAAAIDPVVTELNEQITTATENFPIPIEPSLTGEDLLTLLFCLIENGMTGGLNEAEGKRVGSSAPPIPENFFPRVSMDGIDFTGTVSGMLMMPPSPLGLIYLLLELLKNDVTNQTQNVIDANTENADANECDDTTEIIDEESPCDDPPE